MAKTNDQKANAEAMLQGIVQQDLDEDATKLAEDRADQSLAEIDLSLTYTGECAGCDVFAPIDDQGLCEECAAKLERDLIRLGDWDFTMAGFGLPEHQRAPYRKQVIEEFGARMELIADPRAPQAQRGKKNRTRRKSK
jgi:hypothetical protein